MLAVYSCVVSQQFVELGLNRHLCMVFVCWRVSAILNTVQWSWQDFREREAEHGNE